jgi:hypothetical protein
MKKNFILLLLCFLIASQAKSQHSNRGYNAFGVGGTLHIPQFPDQMKTTLGFGAHAYGTYQFNEYFSLLSRFAFRSLQHTTVDLVTGSTFHDINLTLAGGIDIPQISNTRFLLGVQPTSVLNSETNTYFSSLENANSIPLFGGIQLDLNSYTTLEFSYTQPLRQTTYPSYVDAIPPMFTIGLSTNFNTLSSRVNHWREMKKTLYRLQNDTLYFINRSCVGELSDARLEDLLSAYYTFSAFKVLKEEDITNGLLPKNPIHFAVIGQFYAGKGEPLTTGIYLLDKEMLNVKFPYKMYVPIYNSSLNCMGAEKNIIGGIVRFNQSLGR